MGKPLSLSLLGLLALTIAVLAIGCGTVCNLAGGFVHPEEEPKVYGGVQRDLGFIGEMASDPKGFNCPAGSQGAAMTAIFILGMAAVDPVLSLVGDTPDPADHALGQNMNGKPGRAAIREPPKMTLAICR